MRPDGHDAHAARDAEMSQGEHARGGAGTSPGLIPGLAIADSRLRLEADPTIVAAGEEIDFAFRLVGRSAAPVTSFDELHERRMHLIVVRRDLTGFQHLHPEMEQDGTWRTRLVLPAAGVWRAFADFGTGGNSTTLGIDVFVEGDFRPEPLSDPTTTVRVAGDIVSLDASLDVLQFTVARDGEPVQVEPYLGAQGHLVVLRWGDLAFLHVHPVDEEEIAFVVKYPSEGKYRLFLQYSVDGDVRTAGFTAIVT